jgi:hypothetical protein
MLAVHHRLHYVLCCYRYYALSVVAVAVAAAVAANVVVVAVYIVGVANVA